VSVHQNHDQDYEQHKSDAAGKISESPVLGVRPVGKAEHDKQNQDDGE